MNFRRMLSLLVLFIILPLCGGCESAKSLLFPPAYFVSIVNNTNVPLDIEWRKEIQHKGLLPGETHSFELWAFHSDTQIVLLAKGHHGGKYIGTTSRTFYLPNRKGIHEEWIINSLSAPGNVSAKRGP